MEPRPITARVPPGAVESAALTRIAELERELAQERIDSSRRLKEVEPRIEQFRTALRSMNGKLKEAAAERVVLDARLAGEIDETDRLARRVEELETRAVAVPARSPAERPPARGPDDTQDIPAEDAAGADAEQDDARPDVIGLRIDGEPEVMALGRRYEAHDTDSRRDVSILVFAHHLSKLNGARLDAVLQARHQNLASAIAFGRTRARPYVVFERAAGETLDEWLRRAGPAAEPAALRVALQVARGLREAAFHGALHGDLTPGVVRVTTSGDVKVEDVGLGELHAATARPVPSPEFAAPERMRDGPPPDARADIFSLGAVLHYVLTGRAPFEAGAPRPAGQGPDPRKRRPTISPEAAALVQAFTTSDAASRPATWDEALAAIELLVSGRPEAVRAASAEPGLVARLFATHPYIATAVAASPLVAAALWLHFGPGFGLTARERFEVAARESDALAASGDTVGAAFALGRHLRNTGDPAVEHDAFARLDKLRRR